MNKAEPCPDNLLLNPAAPSTSLQKVRQTRLIEQLYHSCWSSLCTRLRKLYGNGPPDPQDIAQDAFTKLSQMDSLQHVQNPKAFLYKVAINLGLRSISHVIKTREFLAEQLDDPDVAMHNISPESQLLQQQQLHALQQAMTALTDKQRDILIRCRIQGQTYANIATQTGWSLADISRQLNSALAHLASSQQQD
ncbi:RNA polymerase sigma factor [Bowmanella denitrificans]|uniref:RNA polymerase sigma factor n=1 Tax=Bowmanella denitrificans TaxID=366582 RepID=UPI001558C989|nr:sigma-70 family RNA polymerase sigma factor [Bowmanella denitrificans]